MRKMAAILISAMCITGCDAEAQSSVKHNNLVREMCIDGVVYLIYDAYRNGGITPKIDAEYYPYTCPTIKK